MARSDIQLDRGEAGGVSDQVKKTAGKRRWLRRLLWGAALAFVALQAHSYYYLRFMVLYPYSSNYEPSTPGITRQYDVVQGLIRPMLESLNVARMHWVALSQKPPQIEGLTLLKGKDIENIIIGKYSSANSGSNNYSVNYKKNQTYEYYHASAYASIDFGIYTFFNNKLCNNADINISCTSIYKNKNNELIYIGFDKISINYFYKPKIGRV